MCFTNMSCFASHGEGYQSPFLSLQGEIKMKMLSFTDHFIGFFFFIEILWNDE